MATVADTHHLTRRGNVWYYRRRVPDDLVAASGKPVLQYSLDTTDKREAIRRREVEDLTWSARFASCATEPATSPARPEPTLSKSALIDLVRSHVEEVVGRFEARYAADPPESEAQRTHNNAS